MPLVGLGLLKLTPQGVVRDAKLPGYLSNAPVWRGPDKTDGFLFEFWRVAWCCSRHRVDSLRRHSYPKLWFVRRPGSSPVENCMLCSMSTHRMFYFLQATRYAGTLNTTTFGIAAL